MAGPKRVARTVDAVLEDPAAIEVLVVTDGPDPETEAALAVVAQRDARLRVVAAPAHTGAPAGEQRVRDHGARTARGDVILALDDDIVAGPGLVSGHARWHETADLVVLGYMPVAPPPPGERWNAATRLYAEGYEGACRRLEEDPGSILEGLWGGNFSVRREHWLAAAGLDPIALEHMHTDREFGLRLRRLGLRGRFDRRLRAVHEDVHDLTRLTHSARGTAIAHARLHAAYADLDDDHSKPWLRGALRPVACRPRLWAVMLGGLMAFTRFAGARRLRALEYGLSRGVWRLEYERTLHEAREHPPSAARDPAG